MKTLLSQNNLVFNPPMLGCVLYLPGLPGSGSKIYDRSPYGNHGTIIGATWKKLPSGLWYLSFDGIDDRVNCGDYAYHRVTSQLTIELWANLQSLDDTLQYLLNKQSTIDPMSGYGLYIRQTTDVLGIWCGGLSPAGVTSDVAITTDTWYHLVGTYNGSSLTVYVNAVSKSVSSSGSINWSNIENLWIGARAQGPDAWADAFIAIPRVYNRALSALEIQNHFNREKRLFGVW